MSSAPSWYSWLSFPFFAPLSGSVSQDIGTAPYVGIPEIEADVVREAGSFGRQLGILSEAVIALARQVEAQGGVPLLAADGGTPPATPPDTPLGKLQALVRQVDAIKARHKAAALREAERALDRLKALDPDKHADLVRGAAP